MERLRGLQGLKPAVLGSFVSRLEAATYKASCEAKEPAGPNSQDSDGVHRTSRSRRDRSKLGASYKGTAKCRSLVGCGSVGMTVLGGHAGILIHGCAIKTPRKPFSLQQL